MNQIFLNMHNFPESERREEKKKIEKCIIGIVGSRKIRMKIDIFFNADRGDWKEQDFVREEREDNNYFNKKPLY